MAQLSIKNIIIAIIIIVLLVHCSKILRVCAGLYVWTYDSLEPFRTAPHLERYILVVAVFLLVYVMIVKLFQKRK